MYITHDLTSERHMYVYMVLSGRTYLRVESCSCLRFVSSDICKWGPTDWSESIQLILKVQVAKLQVLYSSGSL